MYPDLAGQSRVGLLPFIYRTSVSVNIEREPVHARDFSSFLRLVAEWLVRQCFEPGVHPSATQCISFSITIVGTSKCDQC